MNASIKDDRALAPAWGFPASLLARVRASSTPVERPRLRRPGAPARGTRLAIRLGLAASLVSGGLLLALATEGKLRAPGLPGKDAIARALGFGIDQVSLTGHRFTLDTEVFDALDLANARSVASFDAAAAKARIERLPWVATAEITRSFPNRLGVRITERKPFALWARGGQRYLVDDTGRVLAPVGSDMQVNLPRISGEGAAADARAMLDLVSRYPDLARRLVEAERVAERRWRLKLAGGVTVDLPVDREASALELIAARAGLARLVAGPGCIIDLRTMGRVAVRPAAKASAGACAGKS